MTETSDASVGQNRYLVVVVDADAEGHGKRANVSMYRFGVFDAAVEFAERAYEYEVSLKQSVGGYPDTVFLYDLNDPMQFDSVLEKIEDMDEFFASDEGEEEVS